LADLGVSNQQFGNIVKSATAAGASVSTAAGDYEKLSTARGNAAIQQDEFQRKQTEAAGLEFGVNFPAGPGSGLRSASGLTIGRIPFHRPLSEEEFPQDQYLDTLRKLTQAGTHSIAGGGKELDTLLQNLEKGFTPEAAQALSPGTARLVARALGIRLNEKSQVLPGDQIAHQIEAYGQGAFIPEQQFRSAIGRDQGEIGQAFEASQKGPTSIDDGIQRIKTSLEHLASELEAKGIGDALTSLATKIDEFSSNLSKSPIFQYLAGLTSEGKKPEQGQQPIGFGAVAQSVLGLEPAPVGQRSPQRALFDFLRSLYGASAGVPSDGTSPVTQDTPTALGVGHRAAQKEESIPPGADYLSRLFRRREWQSAHPGEPLPEGLQSGGYISGPGTGTSDSIFTTLPPGGFVLNAESTAMVGVPLLDRLTKGFFGGGGTDGIPGYVSNGEYLVEPDAVKGIGSGVLNAINSMRRGGPIWKALGGLIHLAEGGQPEQQQTIDLRSEKRLEEFVGRIASRAQQESGVLKNDDPQTRERYIATLSRHANAPMRSNQQSGRAHERWVKSHLHHKSAAGLTAFFDNLQNYNLGLPEELGSEATSGPIRRAFGGPIGSISSGLMDALADRIAPEPSPVRMANGGDVPAVASAEPRTPVVLQFLESGHEFSLEATGEKAAQDLNEFAAERQTSRGYTSPTWDR
jgi:hypothetical protein